MIRIAIVGLLLALPVFGSAQESAQAAELARIDAERSRAEAEFATQEKACYARFAVNDCIEAARKRRRDVVSELRRQEVAINDAMRQRKATERVREIEARQAEQRLPLAAPASSVPRTAASAGLAPLPAAVASQPLPLVPRGKAAGANPASAEAPAARTPKVSSPRPAAQGRDNARRYQERQAEAEQHKKRAQEKAAENNKASRPLPVPP